MTTQLNELVQTAYETAVEKGWHDTPTAFCSLVALLHTEVTEALEEDNFVKRGIELGDIIIRTFDLCGYFQLNLEEAMNDLCGETSLNGLVNQGKTFETLSFEQCALRIHTAISNVTELYRLNLEENEKKKKLAYVLAIVCSTVVQTANTFRMDIKHHVLSKMEANKRRPYKHGGKII